MTYLYLTSDSDKNYFGNNAVASFRVRLPTPLHLPGNGEWMVAMLDISLPRLSTASDCEYLTINSNICQPSMMNSSLRPVLHRLYSQQLSSEGGPIFSYPPRYVSVNAEVIHILEFHILDQDQRSPSFSEGRLCCTLHFKRK